MPADHQPGESPEGRPQACPDDAARSIADGSPPGRRLDLAALATAFGVDAKTVRTWHGRSAAEGEAGLVDRSSRPWRRPSRLSEADAVAVATLRRRRLSGPAIARRLGRPVSTVAVVRRRHGLGQLSALDPKPAIIRYHDRQRRSSVPARARAFLPARRQRPGALLHLDVKKLGRIDGVGHRISGDRRGQERGTGPPGHPGPGPCGNGSAVLLAADGSSCTSASTAPRGSPTRRSCPTSGKRARSPSSSKCSPGSPGSASPSSG